jgi:hypothetical protein
MNFLPANNPRRSLEAVAADILVLGKKADGLIADILGSVGTTNEHQ